MAKMHGSRLHQAGLPEGYKVKYWPSKYLSGAGIVSAHPVGQRPSGTNWHSALSWDNQGKIDNVDTKPEHQRKGLANALFQHVLDNYRPDLMHDRSLTADGRAWSESVGGQPYDDEEYQRRLKAR
jgi:GNAT superfamily N-acetyltransferase